MVQTTGSKGKILGGGGGCGFCGVGTNDGGLVMGTHGKGDGLILWVSRHRVGGGLGHSTVCMEFLVCSCVVVGFG
jgi:hypothetical protein